MEENNSLDYKLRLSDIVPLKGFYDYITRNNSNTHSTPRFHLLQFYNFALGTEVVYHVLNGLEKVVN